LTRGDRLATLDRSEGIGMADIDDRTVAGLKASLVRAFAQGDAAMAAGRYEPSARLLPPGRRSGDGWRWAIDMWNSDAG
jgi:hypothetical protein